MAVEKLPVVPETITLLFVTVGVEVDEE